MKAFISPLLLIALGPTFLGSEPVQYCHDSCCDWLKVIESDYPNRQHDLHKAAGVSLDWSEEEIARHEKAIVTEPDLSIHVPGPPKWLAPTAPRAVTGSLTGRIIYVMAGHGWTPDTGTTWILQRTPNLGMVEDMGNLDQATLFADMALNAGATVVPLRPFHRQPREVVIDNVSPSVTFTGTWFNSTSTIFYGAAGNVPYRYANTAPDAVPTATARYTATIPLTGFYPVYVHSRSGADRISQQYIVGHSGGTTSYRINHRMVGSGWVYIGNYHFESGGTAYVEITNSRLATDPAGVVIADAVRFGNGMGNFLVNGATSGRPREEENGFYWAQESVGTHPTSPVAATNSVSAPRELAEYMNREGEGTTLKRIYLSFHSNAAGSTARGADGLFNSDSGTPTVPNGNTTPDSFRLAELTGFHTNDTMYRATRVAGNPFPATWGKTGTARQVYGSGGNGFSAYGEINNTLNPEMGVTIIETAFHTNTDDVAIMLDARGREMIARANLHAVIAYFAERDGGPATWPPEPPESPRVISASDNSLTLSWTPPVAGGPWQSGSGAPTGYVVYISENGYGFRPLAELSGAAVASYDVTEAVPIGKTRYFRVTATNAGGESFVSPTVGARRWRKRAPILIVDGFDRQQRSQNYIETIPQGTFGRVWPRYSNSKDYLVPYGRALTASLYAFDSCQNEHIEANTVSLSDYHTVIWILGEESTTDRTFNATEQARVTAFVQAGGNFFTSGAEIGWDLDRASGPTAGDRAFFNYVLRARLASNADDDAGTYTARGTTGELLASVGTLTFSSGSDILYDVDFPDVLTPNGQSARGVMEYVGGRGGFAAIYGDANGTTGATFVMGFPFETILSESTQSIIMGAILQSFGVPRDPTSWTIY